MNNTCCFFGHRKITKTEKLIKKLLCTVEMLITEQNINTFLFGSKSGFDDLCYKIISLLKEKYPHIKRVYVRAEYPFIDQSYEDYLLKRYEETYYPQSLLKAGRAVYVERNCQMIKDSWVCIAYYNPDYIPADKAGMHYAAKRKSGTKIAFEYAKSKEKKIINLYTPDCL